MVGSVAQLDHPSVQSWLSEDSALPSAPNRTRAHSHAAPRSAHSTTSGRRTRRPVAGIGEVGGASKWMRVVVAVDETNPPALRLCAPCHSGQPLFVQLWVGSTAPAPQVGPRLRL